MLLFWRNLGIIVEGFWVCPYQYFNLDHEHAFEVNLPVIPSYHTCACITALSWRAVTTLPSSETKPENVFQLLMGVQSIGPDFRQTEVYMFLKKHSEWKRRWWSLCPQGTWCFPLCSSAPTARRHRARSDAEKGHQGMEWLSEKWHLMKTFWLGKEVIEWYREDRWRMFS